MDSLSDALKQRLDRHGLDQAVSAATHLEQAKRVLPDFAVPKTFRAGIMTIEINTAAQAYFFKQELASYLEQINAAIGQPLVLGLRLQILHK